jgi:hypothetical protein
MLILRPQVKAFLDTAETLLSPALLTTPLNDDERGMVRMYLESLDKMITVQDSVPHSSRRTTEADQQQHPEL